MTECYIWWAMLTATIIIIIWLYMMFVRVNGDSWATTTYENATEEARKRKHERKGINTKAIAEILLKMKK